MEEEVSELTTSSIDFSAANMENKATGEEITGSFMLLSLSADQFIYFSVESSEEK